jgi:hypothetical protein
MRKAFKDAFEMVERLKAEGRPDDAKVVIALLQEAREVVRQLMDLNKRHNEIYEKHLSEVCEISTKSLEDIRSDILEFARRTDAGYANMLTTLYAMREAELGRVRKAGAANQKVTDDQVRAAWNSREAKSLKILAADLKMSEKQAAARLAALGLRQKRFYKKAASKS